jgi:hypothetical protein
MAIGYGIALVLEAAGLAGLVFGLLRMRTERRARAAELRGLLLTGNAQAASNSAARNGQEPRRVVVAPAQVAVAQDVVAARQALDRALESLRRPERQAA